MERNMSGRHAKPMLGGWPMAFAQVMWPWGAYCLASLGAVLLVLFIVDKALL
jgi:hypothetical protein